jgi:hypothetical protein
MSIRTSSLLASVFTSWSPLVMRTDQALHKLNVFLGIRLCQLVDTRSTCLDGIVELVLERLLWNCLRGDGLWRLTRWEYHTGFASGPPCSSDAAHAWAALRYGSRDWNPAARGRMAFQNAHSLSFHARTTLPSVLLVYNLLVEQHGSA